MTRFTYRFNNRAICKSISYTDTIYRTYNSPINSHTIPHPPHNILNCTAPPCPSHSGNSRPARSQHHPRRTDFSPARRLRCGRSHGTRGVKETRLGEGRACHESEKLHTCTHSRTEAAAGTAPRGEQQRAPGNSHLIATESTVPQLWVSLIYRLY